jgi:hypothetical protein
MRRDSSPPGVQCGTASENVIEARGSTQAAAWHAACRQAETLRILRR